MGHTMKSPSGNYDKTFMAIQRSDKKLWPFSTVIPVWSEKISYSSSRDSMGNTMKSASGNYCNTFMAIQRSDQKLWPFSTVILVWSNRTYMHRVGISSVIQGKRPPETTVKL